MTKSFDPSDVRSLDREPTKVATKSGVFNPDKEGKFAIAHMKDGSRRYLYKGKPVPLEDAFGALTGQEKIPRVGVFSGIGEGTLRKPWDKGE